MIATDGDVGEGTRVILLVNLATTKKKLKKQLKLLFFEETLVEAVEDAAVETPLANLVKTVRPTNLVKTVLPVSPMTLRKSLVTAMIANVGMDVAATDADTGAREILHANLAMTTKKLKKPLKPLFSDEISVEAVEDAAVVTPPANLVKTVRPANLVTLPKSLVTAMIATDVDAGEGTRVIRLVNLATTKKLKKQLKLLFFGETLVEAVEDAAVETPLANLVKTVRPANPVTLRKSLATAMIANVGMDVAATDVDT